MDKTILLRQKVVSITANLEYIMNMVRNHDINTIRVLELSGEVENIIKQMRNEAEPLET